MLAWSKFNSPTIEFADKVTHEMIHSGSRIISLRSSRLGTGLALDMSQRGKNSDSKPNRASTSRIVQRSTCFVLMSLSGSSV